MFTPAPNKFQHDAQYMDILCDIRQNGIDTPMRNMVCKKVHGRIGRYNMKDGLPIMMHKKIYDSFSKEMSWMTRGETNTNTLGCGIWDKWADEFGELGPVYGEQMRKQVFYKIAYDEADLIKFTKAGYKQFGCAELTESEIIEDIGEERFTQLLRDGVIEGHYVDPMDANAEPYQEFPVTLMRKKVDQLQRAIDDLKAVNETGIANRRILISLWNNADYEMQALPPCHTIFHFLQLPVTEHERYEWVCSKLYDENETYYTQMVEGRDDPAMAIRDMIEQEIHSRLVVTDPERPNQVEREYSMEEVLDQYGAPKFKLDLVLFMRSNDFPVGAPFNIAGYAQVLIKIAQEVNMVPNELIHFASDAHIYEDQYDAVEKQIEQYREMLSTQNWSYPSVELTDTPITEMTHEDFKVMGYNHMPHIPTPVAE